MADEGLWFFADTVLGLALGFITTCYFIKKEPKRKRYCRKTKKNPTKKPYMNLKNTARKIRTKTQALIPCKIKMSNNNTAGAELLDEKLKKSKTSVLEFNCAADGVDTAEYIRKRRQREDAAYNILKNRKNGRQQHNE